ncbi:hypothetical protein [Pseudoalteromonas denitrificans]|uniref:Uncharacterized protein n=1 Tax=Pseudoalteromonas denitrificans DSM 6059 TaxID=1123010 RepID=A0A1I1T1R5_9GAMM|nr:hypothetical protein [Pseudoalteromonas denitrificans]SFD52639.1 hypothetical protein SAMN02745724_04761 [Pseudoalteromonas denitrificans DSM 6059]
MKLAQFLKNELGRDWSADCISQTTEGALSKRTANNWYNGEKRPILDLVIDGLKYRQLLADSKTE